MNDLRFAVFGAGFWSKFQLAAWQEVPGAKCVAIFNRTRAKAEQLASEFDVPSVYDDADTLLRKEELDFVDIITDVGTHRQFVLLAARHGISAICQKPLAESLADAREIVAACDQAGTKLLVHENWRWQAPMRALKDQIANGQIGKVFRARIHYSNSFPVFDNQPFLKDLDQFILTDIGTHILDASRFLFGEATRLYCQTQRIRSDIRGEDVASVMLQTEDGATVTLDMSYAGRLEHDRFPETFVLVEGSDGSVALESDYWVRTTTEYGTLARRHAPARYSWADPAYDLVHASIVPCHRNLLQAMRGAAPAETTGADNLRTLELVYAAYDSANRGTAIDLTRDDRPEREQA